MTTRTSPEDIAKQFDVESVTGAAKQYAPSYNIAPTQQILVVTNRENANHESERQLRTMHWGLVPFFSKDRTGSARMINARAESVVAKPAYRRAFSKRRCIIPADGFYEWQKLDSKNKQPWYFHPRDGRVLALAGLWEVWHDPNLPEDADPLISTTIITTDANADMADVHNRMPLVLTPERIDAWLDSANADLDALQSLLVPPPPGDLDAYRISSEVNRATNNGAELLEPLPEQA